MGVYLGNECVGISSGIPSSSGLPDNLEKLMNYIQENGTTIDMTNGATGFGYYSVTAKVIPDSSYASNPFILRGVVIKYQNDHVINQALTPVDFPEGGDYIYGSVIIYLNGSIAVGGTFASEDWDVIFESHSSTCYYLPFSS